MAGKVCTLDESFAEEDPKNNDYCGYYILNFEIRRIGKMYDCQMEKRKKLLLLRRCEAILEEMKTSC